MSNTFDGVLREFPFIGLDRFNTSALVFLLTHCHADHLSGISNKSFTNLVYCSKETKMLLALDKKLTKSLKMVKAVPYNVRTRLETPPDASNAIYITLIEAYHCLGASMFLVEELSESASVANCSQSSDYNVDQVSRAVLCTGDLRAEQWWRESVHQSPALFPYLKGDKSLDCIYFDSTFAYRGEPFIEIPPNNHGIHAAVSMLREYPRSDPEIEFEFSDTTLGFEQAWAFILSYFGGSLKVHSKHLAQKLELVAEYDRINGKTLKSAMTRFYAKKEAAVFHGGAPSDSDSILVKIKQCINFNIRDYTGICCPIPLNSVPSISELQLIRETKAGNKLFEYLDRLWILPYGGTKLLPLEVKLIFSRHSSYSEVRAFLEMFTPRQVFPCFYSPTVWRNGFSMARVFGHLCIESKSSYDEMMVSLYGALPKEVVTRSIATINRWSISECEKEEIFIKEIMKQDELLPQEEPLKGPALLNLRKVVRVPFLKNERSSKDFDFIKGRHKDFSLQKMTEGRRSLNYEKFVQKQQMLYYKKHNLPQYKRDYQSPKYSKDFTSALGGSSDYDTDSCGSSLDLLARTRKSVCASGSAHQRSFIACSQPGLFWKVQKDVSRHPSFTRNSLVKSSFDSFEEDMSPPKHDGQRTEQIYYNLEGHVDFTNIDELSTSLMHAPRIWQEMQLCCIPSQ